ncbi:putative PEP-binding protein [Vibrio casei]|uniref:putative PEP-binding protein n=1 Tax=Vibrio casei TaxID=673372 RepID=UPI003F99E98A
MSQSHQGKIPANALLGDVLPSPASTYIDSASHLFVSLSELVKENISYHPEIGQHLNTLSDTDKVNLDSLLNGQTVDEHFVSTLVCLIEAAIKPQHQHVRICLSDTDSYSYSALIGGNIENTEINPAMGLRGVARFASNEYQHSFELECKVIAALRDKGVDVEIVVPFVRSLSDAALIIDHLAIQRLPRGLNGLKVLYCCDAPAAVFMADRLLQYFDGLVVNTSNLTQLTLGVDQQNESLNSLFNPEHDAVLMLISQAVKSANNANKPCVVYCQNLAQYPKVKANLAELDQIQVLAAI